MDKILAALGLGGVGFLGFILVAALSPIIVLVLVIAYVVLGSMFALLTGITPPGL